MDERLFETVLKGDTPNFLNLVQKDEEIIKQTVPGSLNTVLHLAARYGHEELALEILKLCPEMLAATNEKLETPVHEACREGRLHIVRLFLETDSWVVHKMNRNEESALYVACERGRLDVVKQLLNYPSVSLLEMDDGLTTSLHVAASAGHLEIVNELLEARQEFTWKKDPNGRTPLHLCSSKGHLEITRELLKMDPDLSSSQDNEGRTPLHWATIKGRVNIIDEILSVNLESSEIRTLHGETVLHLGVKNNQYEAVKHLMETLNTTKLVNTPDNDGNTILHLATAGKFTSMVIYLLKLGVQVNAINRNGFTALDIVERDASNRDAFLIVSALQEAGAKNCDQLPPVSPDIQIQPLDDTSQSIRFSMPKKVPKSSSGNHPHWHLSNLEKQIEVEKEGLRNARKTIIVVAVLIATVTFAAGINPPGGYNQVTGKSIVGKQISFKVFMVCNILALFLSLGIVILLVSNIHVGRKSLMKLLAVMHKLMWLSISLMAAAYVAALWTIMPHGRGMVWELVVLVSVGGVCTLAIFAGLMALSVRHLLRIRKSRKILDKYGIPDSSTSLVAERQMMQKESSESSDSEFDNSYEAVYALY